MTAASAVSTVRRVGSADGVEVVDLAALLAQPQPLGEEEEVELAALGGLREVDERVELDLALRPRVAPHGGVVHAGEVRGEDDLLQWLGAHRDSLIGLRSIAVVA